MDSRFAPLPSKIQVPLYPLFKPFCFSQKLDLRTRLADYYQVDPSQLLLTSKASGALCAFLSQFPQTHVALPSFCCPEVAQAILQAQCYPVFLELDSAFQISKESLCFAAKQGCKFVIWPHFFGSRPLSTETKKFIRDLNFFLIEDEAQSFPHFERGAYRDVDVVLFSFGPSKRLGGIGGGGLCIFRKELQKAHFSIKAGRYNYRHYLKHLLSFYIKSKNTTLAQRLDLYPNLESDLKVLLEKRNFSLPLEKLSSLQEKRALFLWDHYLQNKSRFERNLSLLKQVVQTVLGKSALRWIDPLSHPSIFAVDVDSKRYLLGHYFSQKQIQTTWYYYPLSLLSRWQKFPHEILEQTLLFSSRILILPFQWGHTDTQVQYLAQCIYEYADYPVERFRVGSTSS